MIKVHVQGEKNEISSKQRGTKKCPITRSDEILWT